VPLGEPSRWTRLTAWALLVVGTTLLGAAAWSYARRGRRATARSASFFVLRTGVARIRGHLPAP
jgi:hypothetical protein